MGGEPSAHVSSPNTDGMQKQKNPGLSLEPGISFFALFSALNKRINQVAEILRREQLSSSAITIPIHRETMESIKDIMTGNVDDEDKECFITGLDHTLGVPYNENYEETDRKINAAMGRALKKKEWFVKAPTRSPDLHNQDARQLPPVARTS